MQSSAERSAAGQGKARRQMVANSTQEQQIPSCHQTERCCQPGQCEYRPDEVAIITATIRAARAAGEDVTARSVFARPGGESTGPNPNVSTELDIRHLRRIWDVQRAQAEGCRTIEQICKKLCPFAIDDGTHNEA